MSALLEVRHVSRAFRTTLAVDDVSFEVQPGELLGLIVVMLYFPTGLAGALDKLARRGRSR